MDQTKPITIGSHTFIDFPRFGITKVPAKVDTGADSSSIWASNIKEKNGKLSFSLFAPNSKYYSGEVINTGDYTFTTVKNSFGHKETRYKVRLATLIEGRLINIRFTLANRADNNFPVLIGRQTLHGRFLVDVTRTPKREFDVLVLKPKLPKTDGIFDKFFYELEQEYPSMRINFATYSELKFMLKGKRQTIGIERLKKNISDFNLIYFLVIGGNKDIASAVALHLEAKDIPFIDRAVAGYNQSLNKLHQNIMLQNAEVRVPTTVYMNNSELAKSFEYLKNLVGLPFILKDINSNRGRNNYLIKSESQFKRLVRKHREEQMLVQKYIENDGDYRLLVVGGSIKLVIRRKAKAGSHLNNLSAEGSAEMVSEKAVPASIRRAAIRAVDAFNLSIAGVDMIRDKKTGLWYCLEVNENPQIVSGSFPNDKRRILGDYMIKRLRKI